MKEITCIGTIVLIGYSTGKRFINGVDLSTFYAHWCLNWWSFVLKYHLKAFTSKMYQRVISGSSKPFDNLKLVLT